MRTSSRTLAAGLIWGLIWGLFLVPVWLHGQGQVIVGPGWIRQRSWLGALFRTDGVTYPLEADDILVRSRRGQIVLRPHRRESIRFYLSAADWQAFSAAVQAQGVSVIDDRESWETANPELRHIQLVMQRLRLHLVVLSLQFPILALIEPVLLLGALWSVGSALALGAWGWALPGKGVMPDRSGGRRDDPAEDIRAD
jgi:hypothetical protein